MGAYYNILDLVLTFVRFAGLTVIFIAALVIFIHDAIKSKLSPARMFTVAASAIIAGVLFWVLPGLIEDARQTGSGAVPNNGATW